MKDDRFSAIRQFLYSRGSSSILEIAETVNASAATVRRDLQQLEADGVITRTHGGARLAEGNGVETAFEVREQQRLSAKRAIADQAFAGIRPNSAVFLDAGTTVLQIARRIRLNPMPLSVFTNCVTVAQVLMDVAPLRVTLIGGVLRPENASMVGSIAEETLERLWFDQLFLGAGALAEDCCIYSLDESEARLNGKMLARASSSTLVIDSSKFGKRLTYRVAPVNPDLDVITDDGLTTQWRERLANEGCNATVVPAGGEPE